MAYSGRGRSSSSTPRVPPTGSSDWQRSVLCRYFTNGCCRAGAACSFSHDPSISNRGTIPCKYYSQGTCANGNNCRFSHERKGRVSSHAEQERTWVQAPEFVPTGHYQNLAGIGSTNFSSVPADPLNYDFFNVPSGIPADSSLPIGGKDSTLQNQGVHQTPKSWAHVVNPVVMAETTVAQADSELCPYYQMGECRYNELCSSLHGEICDLCCKPMLHPTHEGQRKAHKQVCISQHEKEMELAFAIAKSKDKTCGICMEVIIEKQPTSEARFGIMPNCNHCFCISCLRKWRQAKQFEHKITRACPECRQTSDYVCPSKHWIDTPEEKAKLLVDYKDALTKKQCKYFKKGVGECPFGNKCFYRHENQEGVLVDTGPPPRRPRRHNADGELDSDHFLLFNFLEERNERLNIGLELLQLFDLIPDSDDSDDADWGLLDDFDS